MVRVDLVAPGEAAKTEADFSGEFRSDCAYIVVPPGDEPQVYVWSGDAASKKTKQRASKHATDLVESTEGAKSEVAREAQWQESEAFKELFGGKVSYGETEAQPLEAEASQEAPVEAEAAPESAAADAAANGSAAAAAAEEEEKPAEKEAAAEEQQQQEAAAAAKAEEEQPAEAEAAKPEAAEAAPVSPPKAEEPAKAGKASPSPIKVEPPKSGASSPTKPSGSPVKATGKPPTSPTKLQPPAPEGEAELAVKARQILTRRQSGTFVDPFEKKQSGAAGEPATTFTADSAKVWGGAAAAATPPEEIKFQPLKDFFPFEEVKAMRSGSGIDMTRKEDYLSEEEFTKVFGKDRSAFKAQPAWRQQLAKKQFGLF